MAGIGCRNGLQGMKRNYHPWHEQPFDLPLAFCWHWRPLQRLLSLKTGDWSASRRWKRLAWMGSSRPITRPGTNSTHANCSLMPADWSTAEDFFENESDISSDTRDALAAHHLTWREASHRSGDLIDGHELGHAVVEAYGIQAGTRWLNELLASYVLYAYLQSERRDLVWLVNIVQEGNRLKLPQHHVSLDDFESQYMDILAKDGEN